MLPPKILENFLRVSQGLPVESPYEPNQWLEKRKGKFTASRISELCTRDKTGKKMGVTALNYILEKKLERMGIQSRYDDFQSRDMTFGLENEPVAAAMLSDRYEGFQYISDSFYTLPFYNDYAGASPDFLIKGEIVGDIKIPTQINFLKATQVKDAAGVKKHYKEYYYQIQMQMMCTCVNKGLLAFFCPEMIGTRYQNNALHCIEIPRDEAVWQEILDCIKAGIGLIMD
jgi:hypothetical protein